MLTQLLEQLGTRIPGLHDLSGLPLFVLIAVSALTLCFVIGYALKGGQVAWQLWRAVRRIRSLAKQHRRVSPQAVAHAMPGGPFRHLWDEYSHTLHEQHKPGTPAGSPTEFRATMPAEAFFTRDVLVDSRLFDDFTRHLPGVLTGLGIIGTFAGLLTGLGKFDASSTASAVAGLKPLLDGVAHAFSASAIAIGCAMFVTFISRFCLAIFYRQVERLNHVIDGLYATGAGEEYLSRLVESSEKSEIHAAQLKQSLVEDLSMLMTKLADRQIHAQAEANRRLGAEIGDSIAASLAGPMAQIMESMRSGGQGSHQAMGNMIESMVTRSITRLDNTIASPMREMQQQMETSMAGMAGVQQSLQRLVENVGDSNAHMTERLSSGLEDLMKQSVTAQTLLLDEMRGFVDHLDATRQVAVDQEHTRGAKFEARTQELVGGMSSQVEGLLKAVMEQGSQTQRNIEILSSVTLKTVAGMSQGAQNLSAAAQRFETAGHAVSGVLEKSARAGDQMTAISDTLQTTAKAVHHGFTQYDNTRRSVESTVSALTELIASVRSEAGLTQQMLTDLERIVGQFKVAEVQSQQYLEGVNKALVRSFEDFGGALTNQLKSTIGDTDRHLSSGVQQLNGVVQHIGLTLSRMKAN